MTALFDVKLIDANGIHPNETVGNSSETPKRRQTVCRNWQDLVMWTEKDSLAQRRIALEVRPGIRERLKNGSVGIAQSVDL
jgi:hypothetical protein